PEIYTLSLHDALPISRTGPPALIGPKFRRIEDAEKSVLSNRPYVSWASPSAVSKRSQAYMSKGLHEQIFNSNLARLEAFAFVRQDRKSTRLNSSHGSI